MFTTRFRRDRILEDVLGIELNEPFRIGDEKFKLRKTGYRVTSRVNSIGTAWSLYRGIRNELLPHRSELREIAEEPAGAALTFLISRSENFHVRLLAIWLIGRGRHQVATSYLADAASIESNPRMRRQIVLALKNLHAWTELQVIEDRETDERVRNVARQIPSARRQARMELLRRKSESIPRPRSSMRMFPMESSDLRLGKPPKSLHLIRRLLDRISKLIGRT